MNDQQKTKLMNETAYKTMEHQIVELVDSGAVRCSGMDDVWTFENGLIICGGCDEFTFEEFRELLSFAKVENSQVIVNF